MQSQHAAKQQPRIWAEIKLCEIHIRAAQKTLTRFKRLVALFVVQHLAIPPSPGLNEKPLLSILLTTELLYIFLIRTTFFDRHAFDLYKPGPFLKFLSPS